MAGIVSQLQQMALDNSESISELIQKTYFIARKLELSELIVWCENELSGYAESSEECPSYRYVHAVYKAWNPYRGFIPVISNSEDDEVLKTISSYPIQNPITDIEEFSTSDSSILQFAISPKLQRLFNEANSVSFEILAFISRSQFKSIIQQVRKLILDWTLVLEKKGIFGDSISFSAEEKRVAKEESKGLNIEVKGDNNVITAPVSEMISDSFNSTETGPTIQEMIQLVEQIDKHKIDSGLGEKDLEIICKLLDEIRSDLNNTPQNTGRIKKVFAKIKSIFGNVSGSVIATGIVGAIQGLL